MSNYSYFQDFNNSQKNQNPTFENKHLQPVHQHSEYQYSQPGNVKIPQENAEWHNQFGMRQYDNYLKFKNEHAPEVKSETINNRMNTRNTDNQREYQYVPRLQSKNSELCERNMIREHIDRDYTIDKHFLRSSKQDLEANNPFIQNRKSNYTFKNKKQDLNERIRNLGYRVNTRMSMPFTQTIPFLDMRPQNTSEIDYIDKNPDTDN